MVPRGQPAEKREEKREKEKSPPLPTAFVVSEDNQVTEHLADGPDDPSDADEENNDKAG